MRLFETLLVSSVLLVAIIQMVSSFKKWRNKENRDIGSNSPQNLLLIVSFVLFVIHFFLEGIRWQLYYLYAYLIFALIVTFLLKKTLLKNWKGLRTFIEFLREPDSHIGLVFNIASMGQILSIPLIILGIMFFKKS